MPNTFTQIHMQVIFAVEYRIALIKKEWETDLYKYITSIIQKHHHKVLTIGGIHDHIHVFFGMRPTQALSDLVKEVKQSSSLWINDNKLTIGRFSWQEGYGGFSYAKSQIDSVIKYIDNQEQHHYNTPFLEEYKTFLNRFKVDYDEKYIFKELV